MNEPAYRGLVAVLFVAAGLMAGFAGGWFAPHPDGLVAVTGMDYTNSYASRGFAIRCTHRGNRPDYRADGTDIRVGDRLVRDCRVIAR